jgi:hypothetical protein
MVTLRPFSQPKVEGVDGTKDVKAKKISTDKRNAHAPMTFSNPLHKAKVRPNETSG